MNPRNAQFPPQPTTLPPIAISYVNGPAEELAPGALIDNKYEVIRLLGKGGMGLVVSARHLQLDRIVAIKSVHPGLASNNEAVQRLEREAKAAAKLKSEHIVQVLDVGRLPSGLPYFVMEFVEGVDLDQVLVESGTLPIELAVDYLLQACEALAQAHVAGIVHRDLKPSNFLLTKCSDGSHQIKVFDFGIAWFNDPSLKDRRITLASATMGTPSYMAPEQMKAAQNIDQRADIWALGMVLHELVTGSVAFVGGTVHEIIAKVLSSIPAPPMRDSRAGLPPGLELVISHCLEKKPERRYQTVAELALALAPFAPTHAKARVARILGTFVQAGFPVASPVESISPPSEEVSVSVLPPKRQSPAFEQKWLVYAAVVVASLCLFFGILLLSRSASNPQVPASSSGLSVSFSSPVALPNLEPKNPSVSLEAEPTQSQAIPAAPPRPASTAKNTRNTTDPKPAPTPTAVAPTKAPVQPPPVDNSDPFGGRK